MANQERVFHVCGKFHSFTMFHLNLLVSPAKFSGVASTEDIYEAEAAYAASAATIEKLASQVSRIGITCQRYGAFPLESKFIIECNSTLFGWMVYCSSKVFQNRNSLKV